MALFTFPESNAIATLHGLVRGLNGHVTRHTLKEILLSHPDFPSLLSLSDALTHWHIDNTALQLNKAEQLCELPLPFVAHLNDKGGWYVLVTAINGNQITYSDSNRGRIKANMTEFEKQWTGIVLLAEIRKQNATYQSGEANYATKRYQERLTELRGPFVFVSMLIILIFIIGSLAKDLIVADWLLLLTKVVGLSLSSLLVAKQIGNRSTLTDRLCSIGSQTSCDDVLNSPGAKLWGWLSWADVGLLYFAGGLLTEMLASLQPATRSIIYVLALLAMPYILFSIYYQARVIKKWCTLCLLVQSVLLVEGILAFTQSLTLPNMWQPYMTVLTALLLPTMIWVLIKPMLVNREQSQREHIELLRLKHNPTLFNALLEQQPQMPPISEDLKPITLGNPNAKHTITMVTNPLCNPCAKSHAIIEKMMTNNDKFSYKIIFATSDESNDQRRKMASWFLSLPQTKIHEAIKIWFAEKRQIVVDEIDEHISPEEYVNSHQKWCNSANISMTPTIFINGRELPRYYELQNLSVLLN